MKKTLLIMFLLFVVTANSGCVRRIVTIDSQPPGAQVYLDRKLVGETPYSHEFLYYGSHYLELVKEGYSNLNTAIKLKGPIYEYFPLSIFSELLIPWEITDKHELSFKLEEGQIKKPLVTPIEEPQAPLPSPELERMHIKEEGE
ncbi:MAG: PEGA domain-containing protein [Candidatus Omnitrophica bacterium]|nr:PEGA domain-containing protein [Candidatus Omnitrophota bacterium]